MDGCCGMTCISAFTASLCQDDLDTLVVDIVVDGTGSVASTTHTCHQVVGIVATNLLFQLFLDFLRDDALQASYHIGRMTAPVADGFVGSVFQCPVASLDRTYFSTQHLHALYIDVLALYI